MSTDLRPDRAYDQPQLPDELYWDAHTRWSSERRATWTPNVGVSDRSMRKNEGYTLSSSYGLMGPCVWRPPPPRAPA